MERVKNLVDSLNGILDTILLFVIAGLFTMLKRFSSSDNLRFKRLVANGFINIVSGAALYSIAVYLHQSIDEYPLKIGAIVVTTMVGDRILTNIGDTLINAISYEGIKDFFKKLFNL